MAWAAPVHFMEDKNLNHDALYTYININKNKNIFSLATVNKQQKKIK